MKIVESDRHCFAPLITYTINKFGFKKKLDIWVPCALTQNIDQIPKRVVTGDVTCWCVTYNNVNDLYRIAVSRHIRSPKPGWTARKVLVSVGWEWQGII